MRAGATFAVLASCSITLCGCNQLISSEPWFTEADAEGAPQLRDGLWNLANDPDCHFDEAKPAERWPDCADAMVIRGSQLLELEWDTRGEGHRARREFSGWKASQIFLAGGDPPIIQVRNKNEPDAFPADDAAGRAGNDAPVYEYAAMRPREFDGAGKVTRFEIWLVECGPLPTPPPKGSNERVGYVTDKPFPGLTVVDNDCVAESKETLRKAAKMSEALVEKPLSSVHWVRDGYR